MWRDGESKRAPRINHPFWPVRAFAGEDGAGGNTAADASATDPSHALSGPFQELGTIEGRSKGVTTPYGAEFRSSGRWNNIRRSKALERMMGKRSKTLSRTAR
jgi:hypothetical protein